uniref:Uncharacterized protein n=1 Tax=Rhizophora mucronata TaxID=61149 RepID=A0A2P2PJ97_RHIMU
MAFRVHFGWQILLKFLNLENSAVVTMAAVDYWKLTLLSSLHYLKF